MAQVITPELEAILASHLQVGDDKPEAEIEIDQRSAGETTPLLSGATSGSAGTSDEFTLPEVDVAGDDILLLAFIQKRPKDAITLPSGWVQQATQVSTLLGLGEKRWEIDRRYVATDESPYADTFSTSAPCGWGGAQIAVRASGASQPTNKGTAYFRWGYDTGAVDEPTLDVTLDEGDPTTGNVLLGWCTPSGGTPGTGFEPGFPEGYTLPDGWQELTRVAAGPNVAEGVIGWKLVDGTGDEGVSGAPLTFGTTRHGVQALTVMVVEVSIDPEGASSSVVTHRFKAATIDIDRSRKMAAAQLDATFQNEDGLKGYYTQASTIWVPNNPVRAYAWYGDRANRVCVFTGLLDRISEHRNPKTVAVKARSRMKWMLEQGFRAIGPQSSDDADAVRTEANGVFLGKSPEYIFGAIADAAGWPSADRSVGTSGFTLAEYDLTDRGSWADQIAGSDRLTTATGWDLVEDELGVLHFEASPLVAAVEPTPAWAFAAGVNVMALDHQADDEDRATRVEVSGPMTSSVPIWDQTWSTSVLDHPAGVWYDPADPDYIRVIDRVTKRIYRMKQSDRSIASSKYLGGYPLGLSGDPTDPDHYYVLHAPWRNTGSTSGNSVKKYLKADNSLVATSTLPNGRWSGMKFDGTYLYLTNYDDGKVYVKSFVGGGAASAVSNAATVYGGETQEQATGCWLNGTTLGVFFAPHKRFLLMDTSAIGTVTGVQSTEGTRIAGGESDTDTDTDLYAVASKGSFGLASGMVAKFALAELVTNDVTALAIDYDLEDALGVQSGIAARDHDGCPNIVDPHPFEARLATYSMKVVQSLAQAGDVADAQLALRSRLRRQLDLATTGHPGVQLNDPASYADAIAGMGAEVWVIDTYRKRIASTYTQTMSLLPWEAP